MLFIPRKRLIRPSRRLIFPVERRVSFRPLPQLGFGFVQARTAGFGSSSGARSLQYNSNVTAGDLLIVAVSTYNAGITLSISDTQGNSFAQAGAYSAFGQDRVSIWFTKAKSTDGGTPNTVTCTPSAAAYMALGVLEFSFAGATGYAVDPAPAGTVTNGGNGLSASTGPTGITYTNELALAAFGQGNATATWTPGAGFTNALSQTNGTSNEALYVDYELNVSSSVNDTGSFSVSAVWASIGAIIYATTGGAAAPGALIGGGVGRSML